VYAIFEDSGRQYKVSAGDKIFVDLREMPEGQSTVTFDRVLALGEGENARIGQPLVDGAKVVGKFEAEVKGVMFGVIYDPDLAAEAHRHGLHYHFEARFNRSETTNFSEPWTAPARVAALSDGNCVGRRGIYAGLRLALGPCAALAIGGIIVVVVSHRVQCADPVFFEMMGLDIAKARSIAVKSRGHFRGGFDEFFGPEQIVEVDLPGLTSPVLSRFDWIRLPRPVIPLDEGVEFRLT